MKEQVTVITEPLLSTQFVQYREIGPVLEGLAPYFDLAVASPALANEVQFDLQRKGIQPVSARVAFPKLRDPMDEIPSWALSWIRDAVNRGNGKRVEQVLAGRRGLRLNRSMTVATTCDAWCIQSHPLGITLKEMVGSVDWSYRVPLTMATPVVGLLEWAHIRRAAALTGRVYTANEYLADLYLSLGIAVRGTLPPYLRDGFYPSTQSPTRDYILVYMSRELDTDGFHALAETGIPIKLFGAKSAEWVRRAISRRVYPNVQVLGKVSFEELRELYSNALFTAFVFTEESFGLVPLESMACGTPVLTYAKQGPQETVIAGRTGWHVESLNQLAQTARTIWQDRYPSSVSGACVRRASEFSLARVTELWRDLITSGLSQSEEPPNLRLKRPNVGLLGRGPVHPGPWPARDLFVRNLASSQEQSLTANNPVLIAQSASTESIASPPAPGAIDSGVSRFGTGGIAPSSAAPPGSGSARSPFPSTAGSSLKLPTTSPKSHKP